MAARKKKTTVSKKQNSHRTSTAMQLEIQNLLVLLLLVLITLCIFLHKRMGVLGVFLYDVCMGMFGFSAYLLCVYLLVMMIMKIAGVLNSKNGAKSIAYLVCILLLAIFLQIINGDLEETSIKALYNAGSYANGGAWGGIIGGGLVKLMGKTGSLILIIGLFTIAVVLITGKSLIKAIGHLTGSAARGAKSKSEEWKIRREEQRILIEQKREEARIAAEAENAERRARIEAARREAAERARKVAEEAETGQNADIVPEDVSVEDTPIQQNLKNTEVEISDAGSKVVSTDPVSKEEPAVVDTTPKHVDIPILDHDAYLERKRRFQQRNLMEASAMKEGTVVEKKTTDVEQRPAMTSTEDREVNVQQPVAEKDITETAAVDYQEPVNSDAIDAEEGTEELETEDTAVLREEPIHVTLAEENSSDKKSEALVMKSVKGTQLEVEEVYQFPPIDLLQPGDPNALGESREDLMRNAQLLEETLLSYGVQAKVLQVNKGPAVTRYELQPEQGVKVSRIVNLADDIAYNLAAADIRIEAPIPGKRAVGIEIPNKESATVCLRDIIESERFQRFPSPLAFSLGKDIDGNVQVADIAKMPHLLIAGATGSGKSVCINSLLISILYKADPKDVKLILIDPKVVELSVYNGIPHLLIPVVNDPRKAALSLNWAVQEMNKRYKKFADLNVRDIRGYNNAVTERPELELEPMPKIVIIVDELADLMMVSSKEVEDSICRLAQMARAAGLHLVIATQRPSVDVITGLIKANIPSRIAFAVSSGIDSRTILDAVGAEKLLGKGDMLFSPMGTGKPVRIQGSFVSDKEVENVVAAVKGEFHSDPDLVDSINGIGEPVGEGDEEELDEYLEQAIQYVVDKQKASISMLQRVFRIGFNRAARLMDSLYERGIVGPDEGSKPRKVLVTSEELKSYEDA